MFSWYGLIVGSAMVVGYSVAEKLDNRVARVAPWVIFFGIIGARIYHVVDFWQYYRLEIWQVLYLWQGGLSIWGGLAGGVMGLLIYQRINNLSVFDTWNISGAMVVALPLSQAIGRVGNWANGEFGELVMGVSWWAWEASLNLLLFGIMLFIWRKGVGAKERVGIYLVGYGVIRYALELYRLESMMWGDWRVAQVISLCAIVIGLWLWLLPSVQK